MMESKLPAGEQIEKEFAAHMIDRVSVAIAVPTSWFTKIWQKRNPTPPGEEAQEPPVGDIEQIRITEIARIKSLVAGALPKTASVTDPTQLVEVTDFEDIIPPPIPEPTMTANARVVVCPELEHGRIDPARVAEFAHAAVHDQLGAVRQRTGRDGA